MPRFYVDFALSPDSVVELPDNVVRHLNVLRVKNTEETPKQPGDRVKAGDILGYIEAMKTYNAIRAEFDGTITAILVNSGDAVEEDDVIMKIAKQ